MAAFDAPTETNREVERIEIDNVHEAEGEVAALDLDAPIAENNVANPVTNDAEEEVAAFDAPIDRSVVFNNAIEITDDTDITIHTNDLEAIGSEADEGHWRGRSSRSGSPT